MKNAETIARIHTHTHTYNLKKQKIYNIKDSNNYVK